MSAVKALHNCAAPYLNHGNCVVHLLPSVDFDQFGLESPVANCVNYRDSESAGQLDNARAIKWAASQEAGEGEEQDESQDVRIGRSAYRFRIRT